MFSSRRVCLVVSMSKSPELGCSSHPFPYQAWVFILFLPRPFLFFFFFFACKKLNVFTYKPYFMNVLFTVWEAIRHFSCLKLFPCVAAFVWLPLNLVVFKHFLNRGKIHMPMHYFPQWLLKNFYYWIPTWLENWTSALKCEMVEFALSAWLEFF